MSAGSALETAGGVAGGIAGGFAGAAIGSVFGPVGTFAGRWAGSRLGQWGGRAAGGYLASKMNEANDKAEPKTAEKEEVEECIGNCDKKDPCAGIRNQLEKHTQKLEDYIKNPEAHDNLGLLGRGNDSQVKQWRINSLKKQISSWERELEKCEKANGIS